MAKNARQKRAAKRKLALSLLAHDRNPPMVACEGTVRSVWSKAMPPRAHIPFHGKSTPKGSGSARFSGRPTSGDWLSAPDLTLGASDPTSLRAPKSDD